MLQLFHTAGEWHVVHIPLYDTVTGSQSCKITVLDYHFTSVLMSWHPVLLYQYRREYNLSYNHVYNHHKHIKNIKGVETLSLINISWMLLAWRAVLNAIYPTAFPLHESYYSISSLHIKCYIPEMAALIESFLISHNSQRERNGNNFTKQIRYSGVTLHISIIQTACPFILVIVRLDYILISLGEVPIYRSY